MDFLTIFEHLVKNFREFLTFIFFLLFFPKFFSITAIFAPLSNASLANLFPSIFLPLIAKKTLLFFTCFELIEAKLIFFFYNIFNNKYLSYSEFRNLQLIDLNNELDIFYRYEHFKIVTNNFKYLKIGEIIDFYKNNENFKILQSKIKDPINIDLKTDYPRHCDYFFWKNGNSFFANNLIYGFKLNIKDYESVQKMKTAKGLILFSKNYYDYHQEMSENEIYNIFIKQPIRINNNIILNGRHRVCAMIGRILKNEKYINIKCVGSN